MKDIFQKQEYCYSLRKQRSLVSKWEFTTTYGIDSVSFRGLQILQDLPPDAKNSNSLNLFKTNIKRYEALLCHCKICKTFVPFVVD